MDSPVPINIKIDYQKCDPKKCSKDGICPAVLACPHKVLRQEDKNEVPFLHPSRFCRGCEVCRDACPLKAVEKARG